MVNPNEHIPADEELASRAQAGCLAAFDELVTRYEHRVYAFVGLWCRNLTDARDLTQETFVKAFHSLGQYDTRRSFSAWLFTIARRKSIDHRRASPPCGDEAVPELADGSDPSQALSQREESARIWALARRYLPETQFQAVWLKYAEELSVAEIARVLGKTRTHVKVLLFRARQTLSARFESADKVSEIHTPVRSASEAGKAYGALPGPATQVLWRAAECAPCRERKGFL